MPGTTTAALFDLLWKELAEVLGTAATSTVLRRAAKRAAARNVEIADLAIRREGLDHTYVLPPAWQDGREEGWIALRELLVELRPLLIELTGMVVIRRLQRIDAFQQRGLLPAEEEQP